MALLSHKSLLMLFRYGQNCLLNALASTYIYLCFVLEVAGSNPTPASFSFQLLFNSFSIFFFLNFSYNYGCI